jgi:hypothetical protein
MWQPDTSDRHNKQYREILADMGQLKVSKELNMVKTIVNGWVTRRMVN